MLSTRGVDINNRAPSRAALLVAVGLLVVAFVGCGSSDDKEQNTTADNEAAVQKVLRQLQQASVA